MENKFNNLYMHEFFKENKNVFAKLNPEMKKSFSDKIK